MTRLCIDCEEREAKNGRRCWPCSDARRARNWCIYCGDEIDHAATMCVTCYHNERIGIELSVDVKAKIRNTLTCKKHTPERIENQREAAKLVDPSSRFNLSAYMQGRSHPNALSVGSIRDDGDRISIKCPDGKWRHRANAMWREKYGPIPRGYVIHHENFDSYDDRYENFRMITRAEHARLHKLLGTPFKL